MKLLNTKKIKFLLVFVLLLSNQIIVANEDLPAGFDEDVVDNDAAPIDLWVIPMLCLGIAMLFYFTNRKVPSK
jgi:hypothetical protein